MPVVYPQGRNDFAINTITREFGYITWEDAFLSVQSDFLPDSIRAKFTELIIGQFKKQEVVSKFTFVAEELFTS